MKPVRLVRFYLAIPQDYEDKVAYEIGKMGTVELIGRRLETGKREELEVYTRFLRVIDRIKVSLDSVEETLPKPEVKKSFIERFKDAFSAPPKPKRFTGIIPHDTIKEMVDKFENELGKYASIVDEGQKKLTYLKELRIRLNLFKKHNIPIDIIGEYTHIFVKAGLIPIQNLSLLKDYIRPYNVILTVKEGIRKDYLIIIAASQRDKEDILKILSMLNFEEISFPEEYRKSPDEVLKQIDEEEKNIYKELEVVREKLSKLYSEAVYYKRYINFLHKVKSSVMRTRNLTIIDGWIEKSQYNTFLERISKVSDNKLYIEVEEPTHEYSIKPPTKLKNPPGFKGFEILTRMRGIPDYFEIDPTPIFTVLFLVMYGIMFGDIGEGFLLFIMGLIFYKIKKPLLGLSASALNKIGYVLMGASIFGMIFGYLYGVSFLIHYSKPIWISPIVNVMDIVIISIEFGLIQLVLALIMNIYISINKREYFEAVLSWKGVVGLVYFVVGIYIAIQFIVSNMAVDVFTRPNVLPFTILELALVGLVYLKPTIRNIMYKEGKPISETLIEGLGEFIEIFISFLTNSVSYIRLGAFAIAHEALGEAAWAFSPIIGFLPSYIVFNAIVTLLDGFAAGIQSLRLIFYEFSTKFYRDEGRLFKPLKI